MTKQSAIKYISSKYPNMSTAQVTYYVEQVLKL